MTPTAKFTGDTFQESMFWCPHIEYLEKAGRIRLNNLKLLCRIGGATPGTAVRVYQSNIQVCFTSLV